MLLRLLYTNNILRLVRRIQKEKETNNIKHKLIMDVNYDDVSLQLGEDREFKNQFREFLQKNTRIEEPTKKKNKRKKRE